MLESPLTLGITVLIQKTELDILLAELRDSGYTTIGPCLRDESITYQEIEKLDDLPRGFTTDQSPGSYRLVPSGKANYFDYIPGSHSWKQFLFPPSHQLFNVIKDPSATTPDQVWHITAGDQPAARYALVGVRPCELAAIAIQDKVFIRSDFSDPIYRSRRESMFIIAVNCLDPDATCFCSSMGTGPRAQGHFDLCLTELEDTFLVEVGSELGRAHLASLTYELPSAFVKNSADLKLTQANNMITRTLDTSDLPELLIKNLELDRWDHVGKRCLSCASCTQVCPTCFCWDVTDQVDLSAHNTSRTRVWDSCFNPTYSYVFGGNTRPNIRSRYRQWLTHKLGTWKEQFGVLGCVGCGRCITWCPAKIDLTEEVSAIRQEVKP